jgi:hypothetical protein
MYSSINVRICLLLPTSTTHKKVELMHTHKTDLIRNPCTVLIGLSLNYRYLRQPSFLYTSVRRRSSSLKNVFTVQRSSLFSATDVGAYQRLVLIYDLQDVEV